MFLREFFLRMTHMLIPLQVWRKLVSQPNTTCNYVVCCCLGPLSRNYGLRNELEGIIITRQCSFQSHHRLQIFRRMARECALLIIIRIVVRWEKYIKSFSLLIFFSSFLSLSTLLLGDFEGRRNLMLAFLCSVYCATEESFPWAHTVSFPVLCYVLNDPCIIITFECSYCPLVVCPGSPFHISGDVFCFAKRKTKREEKIIRSSHAWNKWSE